MRQLLCALAVLLTCALPAAAQSPGDVVRWVYTSLGEPGPAAQKGLEYLSAPDRRSGYFTQSMVAFFEANDSYGDDLAAACIDFGLAIPGQDYDIAEILRTLSISEGRQGARMVVTAEFTSFGTPARVDYEFAEEDGFLRISDFAGSGFRVSQIPCTPRADAPPPAAQAYCFQNGDDDLRLDVRADGGARLEFSSWQTNGHSCSAILNGQRSDSGWSFPGEGACRIGLTVSAEGDVTLSDPDWACKPMHCGQRAVLDGVRFPRTGQFDCAAWRGTR